jgi:hypothetical protein
LENHDSIQEWGGPGFVKDELLAKEDGQAKGFLQPSVEYNLQKVVATKPVTVLRATNLPLRKKESKDLGDLAGKNFER